MKKFFSLLTLALLTMSAWAATTVTFDYTADTGDWTAAGEFSVTKDDVTLHFSNGTINAAYRVYASSTLTISSASENITEIKFTCTSGNPASNFTAFDGFNTSTGVWTGDAASVVFTATAQVRATLIEVTLGEGGETPVDPDPEPKTYKKVTSVDELVADQKYIIVDEDASVAMASIGNNGGLGVDVTLESGVVTATGVLELTLGGTLNAASFSYDNNGTTTYMAPANKSLSASTDEYAAWVIDQTNFSLSAMIGETEFTLRYNSGASSGPFRCYSSSTGKVVYLYVYDENATPVDPPVENEVESLEITADMGNNIDFTFTGNAGVSYQKGNYLWLRDETGYGLIFGYNNPTFVPGTMLNPGWKATTSIYSGLMEFVNATGLDSIGFNADYAEPLTITELSEDMLNAYVQVLNVKSFAVSGRNVTATLADGTTMVMYNQFNNEVTVPTTEGNYTVLGAVSTHDGLQLMILSIEGNFVNAPVITPASCDFEQSLEVTITAQEDATIKYSYDNETWNNYSEVLTITETTTVYAKAVKGDIESEVVSATYTKVDPADQATYTLVTDASELANGDKIIIVAFHNVDSVTVQPYAMTDFRTNNFTGVTVDVIDNTVTTGLANVITLEANGDNWNLKANDGRYLYADGSDYVDNQGKTKSQNYLKLEDEVDANGYANAAITIANDTTVIEFQGDNDSRFMRFNYNNNNPVLFSCYKETSTVKTPVYIFKAQTEAEGLRGDVNDDKAVTIGDVTDLIDYLLSGNDEGINLQNANCNLDEGVTISDVTALIDFLLSGQW